jgi:hypothetical protein
MDIMAYPYILSCGHSFCYICIDDVTKLKSDCPLCQVKFQMNAAYFNRNLHENIREILKLNETELKLWEIRDEEGKKSQLLKQNSAANTGSVPSSASTANNGVDLTNVQAQMHRAALIPSMFSRRPRLDPASVVPNHNPNPVLIDLRDSQPEIFGVAHRRRLDNFADQPVVDLTFGNDENTIRSQKRGRR